MNKGGRPTKYKKEYCDEVDVYLSKEIDQEFEFHKTRGDKSNSYERHITVCLPTVYGFAKYIGVNKTTLYEWSKEHPEFSNSLEKINEEQKKRLLDKGLSGDYNSTIAKLILSANHGMSDRQEIEHSGDISVNLINYGDTDTAS